MKDGVLEVLRFWRTLRGLTKTCERWHFKDEFSEFIVMIDLPQNIREYDIRRRHQHFLGKPLNNCTSSKIQLEANSEVFVSKILFR